MQTATRTYLVSRLLAGLVVVAPVSIWEFAPTDDGMRPGTTYAAVISGVVLALVAALSARWTTRTPLVVAGVSWLVCLGVLVFGDLVHDGVIGNGDGLIAMLATVTAIVSTLVALLTPLRAPD
jgi:hypothetical protein